MTENISFVDIGLADDMPLEAPEPWTITMYVCLFVGGFWCGAMTFLMILMVKMNIEQRGVQRYGGATMATSPFWVEWRSSTASRSMMRGWQDTTSEEESSESGTSREELIYEEVQVQDEEVEYLEVRDWGVDLRAIHYSRPFEETPVLKTFSCDMGGRC